MTVSRLECEMGWYVTKRTKRGSGTIQAAPVARQAVGCQLIISWQADAWCIGSVKLPKFGSLARSTSIGECRRTTILAGIVALNTILVGNIAIVVYRAADNAFHCFVEVVGRSANAGTRSQIEPIACKKTDTRWTLEAIEIGQIAMKWNEVGGQPTQSISIEILSANVSNRG